MKDDPIASARDTFFAVGHLQERVCSGIALNALRFINARFAIGETSLAHSVLGEEIIIVAFQASNFARANVAVEIAFIAPAIRDEVTLSDIACDTFAIICSRNTINVIIIAYCYAAS